MQFNICVVDSGDGSYRNQLNYVLSSFAPSAIYMIKRPEFAWPTGTPLSGATEIPSAAALPAAPLVVLAPQNGRYIQGNTPLNLFIHPPICTYLVGSDKHFLNNDDHMGGRMAEHHVYIPTDSTDDLFSWVAIGIAISDRRAKGG